MKRHVTQSRLKELLQYNPYTGDFVWKVRPSNRVRVGDVAGSINHGYVIIRIDNVNYYAHRLAFLFMLGQIPEQIDHINHVRNDNRWCNLREATRIINLKNQSMSKNNTSGITGVCWNTENNKWGARINVNCKSVWLGYFHDINEAKAARSKAERHYGFHPNHGVDGVLS